ncbi:MAG: DUF1292 domain-containing protein [Cellulosilyticaceae bacterium]
MEKIMFYDEELQQDVALEIMDQIMVDEVQYLLVADEDDVATILKLIEGDDDELTYEAVEDDAEFQKVALLLMESDEYDIEV